MAQGVLSIETKAGTPSQRGEPTSFTIDAIPSPAEASVTVDGHGSAGLQVTGDDSVRLDLDIGDHQISIAFPGSAGSRFRQRYRPAAQARR